MSARIFISHASKDVKVAQTLCSALESRGLPCWISARDIQPGENFQVSIVQALRHAKIMVLVFTANSNNSEEMTKELAIASQQRLIVIPLRVEDVTPSDAFTYEFATRQWIDVFADWETSIDQLSRRITRALEGAEVAPVVAEAAPTAAADPVAEAPEATTEPNVAEEIVAEVAEVEVANDILPDDVSALEEGEASARSSRAPKFALLAAGIALVAVLGIAGPKLFGKAKPQLPVAAAPPAGLISASDIQPPENAEAAAPLAAMALTETAPEPAVEKVKRRAPKANTDSDIPY